MKRLISLLLTVCMCFSVCVALSSCGHKHTYETEWSKDATHHWHACEGEECAEVSDKAEHIWNGGEITTQPAPDADGVKTYTCTVCGGTKTEPVEYVVDTTVTEDEWNAAFNLGNNWTLVFVATHPTYQQTMTITQMRDGNKFSNSEVMTDAEENVLDEESSYDEIVDNVWYWYHYNYDLEAFTKTAQEESVEDRLAMLIENFFPQFVMDMSDFTYDETNKVYFADTLENTDPYGPQILDATFTFENGKIVAFAYSVQMGGATVPYSATLTYGDASVTLPTVEEEPVETTVTGDEWNTAFLFNTTGHTVTSINGTTTVTTEFDGSTVKMTATNNGMTQEQYFTIEDGEYYFYMVEDANVIKYPGSESFYNNVKTGAIGTMFVYSNFEYDEDSESYKSIEDITIPAGTDTTLVYSNVEIKFEDGKFVSASFGYSENGATAVPSTISVVYGEVPTIEVPTPTNAD